MASVQTQRRLPPAWKLGDRLRLVRRELRLSQAEMAALIDVGAKSYGAWESGTNAPSDIVGLADRLERATGIDRGWWLGWDGDEPPDESATTRGEAPEMNFAARLLLARKLAGLTVREAAMRSGMHYATWSTWERGALPSHMQLVVAKIAGALNCDRDWLMWGGPLTSPPSPGEPVHTAENTALEPSVQNPVTRQYLRAA
jgi:transcriptional regulator with XRE-family HTH domain